MINFNKNNKQEHYSSTSGNKSIVYNLSLKPLKKDITLLGIIDITKTRVYSFLKMFSLKNVFIVHPNQIVYTNLKWSEIIKSK